MQKVLAVLKDIFETVSKGATAWAVLVSVVGFALPYITSLPPWGIYAAAGLAVAGIIGIVVGISISRKFIRLDIAAQRACDELAETKLAEVAERMHSDPSPDRTLEYIANLLVIDRYDNLKLFGVKPPSTKLLQINLSAFKAAEIVDGAKALRPKGKGVSWQELSMLRKDFKSQLRYMQSTQFNLPKYANIRNPNNPLAPKTSSNLSAATIEIVDKLARSMSPAPIPNTNQVDFSSRLVGSEQSPAMRDAVRAILDGYGDGNGGSDMPRASDMNPQALYLLDRVCRTNKSLFIDGAANGFERVYKVADGELNNGRIPSAIVALDAALNELIELRLMTKGSSVGSLAEFKITHKGYTFWSVEKGKRGSNQK